MQELKPRTKLCNFTMTDPDRTVISQATTGHVLAGMQRQHCYTRRKAQRLGSLVL
jgi:hypothetical protein